MQALCSEAGVLIYVSSVFSVSQWLNNAQESSPLKYKSSIAGTAGYVFAIEVFQQWDCIFA